MAIDWSSAASGAATGAGIGGAAGPTGAVAGGVVGGALGLLGGKSKKEKIKNYDLYTPEQQRYIDESLRRAEQGDKEAMNFIMGLLSDEEGAFEDFERPALEQFEQEIVPGILERLNRGGGMSKGGSYLNQSLGQAAKGLSTNLAAQRANLKFKALDQLNTYANRGLTQKKGQYIKGGRPGWQESLAPYAAKGYDALLSQYQAGRNEDARAAQLTNGAVG